MKNLILFTFIAATYLCACQPKQSQMDLSGKWSFALDPDDKGVSEEWFNRLLTDSIKLPGSLQEQGYGNEVGLDTRWTGQIIDSSYFKLPEYEPYRQAGNIKIPFWLQTEKHYVGVAWYQREIMIPSAWKDKYVELELERIHWETTLYVNGRKVGKSDMHGTPCRFAVTETGKTLLSLRIDNRMHIPIGINSHSISDHTQSNWNGIVGEIKLSARPALHIDNIRVYPDLKTKKASIEIDLAGNINTGKNKRKITLRAVSINCGVTTSTKPVVTETDSNRAFAELSFGDEMLTWSEHAPNLYRLEAILESESGTDTKTVTFGMREFRVENTRFTVNGQPVFLRGTLECCIFPLTGYPAMDEKYWTKIYRRCKEFGLNHVRFHSWCPPKAAFEAADHEGIYLQVECGSWANQGSTVGDGSPFDTWLYAESERIVKEYGNHPSFCMFLYGNEPAGKNQNEFLGKFVDYWKERDRRRVYTSGAGWPYIPNADYWSTPDPRIQRWGEELSSVINARKPKTTYDWREVIAGKTMPTVSHEIGQWCVYPNFNEIAKYTGVLKAKNFEIFRETLEKNNLGDMADKFLYASGRLQTLCYKADIEAALRTPGFAGFQLLDLHDFPGQGTALVGVLDPFWDTKGYVDGAEYSMFCNETVPLARMEKLIWTNKETLKADLEIAHFGATPLYNSIIEWELSSANRDGDKNEIIARGHKTKNLPIDNCIEIMPISHDLSGFSEPVQLTLTVRIADTKYVNNWHVWVYPETVPEPDNKPYFTTNLNDALAKASSGGKALYCVPKDALKPEINKQIAVGFSSIFWNTAWTHNQAPHTLGIYCDPTHPALAWFPNEGVSDYQWWDIVTGSAPLLMNRFQASLRPVVYLVGDWFHNHRLGLLFEAKVGAGKLMVCGADLSRDLDKRPAARQFRRSVEQYMASGDFNPSETLDPALLEEWMK